MPLICLRHLAAALAVLLAVTAPAFARRAEPWTPAPRATEVLRPLKDCTRFNGRHGYYGNPWCTDAEQRRFDKWEAKRLGR